LGFWNLFIIFFFFFVVELEVDQFFHFCSGYALFGVRDRPVFSVGSGYVAERQAVARKAQLEGLEFVCSCRGCLVKKN